MKILIIRFSSIGDIVLTTPIIRCLKKQVPMVQIHFAVKKSFATVVESNPYIDKVHVLDNNLQLLIADLKKEGFDYIIDLHKNIRTLRIKNALNTVASFSFNKINIEKWLLTAMKINILPQKHIVDREFEAAKHFQIINDGKGLDYFIPEKDLVKETDIPTSHMHGYIGIAIGGAHATKKMPVDKLKELCSKIEHPIMLLGGKEDYENGQIIASIDSIKIYNACGKFNLNESADLVRKAKIIISHDTGLMHIAAAFKKPIISVWGNTIPGFGMYPYYGISETKNKIFEINNLRCRPCSKIGFQKCPKKHFKCMMQQDIDGMVATVEEWLSQSIATV
ncbi:MAG TPA: glycosyltransferase family 9 protein [Chitinophagaceae bacterium]|nr:glycosyltransferase family 9 protein [Chitinophagaceae bacterium]